MVDGQKREQCNNCRFWTDRNTQAIAAGGMCRRHAPGQYLVDRVPWLPFCYGDNPHKIAAPWPAASPDGWCGDWEEKS